MVGRVLNRRELREQAEQADQAVDAVKTPKAAPKKPKAPAAPRKSRPKKAPPRMRARWGIFDGGMKQVAIFDYNQRAAADQKLADLLERKRGSHFLQVVKEPMPEPEPVAAAAS